MQMKLYEIGSEEIYPLRRHYSCVKEPRGGPNGGAARFRVTSPALTLAGKYDNACGDDKTNGFHCSRGRTIMVNLLIGRCHAVKRIFRRIRAFSRRISRLRRISSACLCFSISTDSTYPPLGAVIILERVWSRRNSFAWKSNGAELLRLCWRK